MSNEDPKYLTETQDVFREPGRLTLADIRARVVHTSNGTRRRDTLSALDAVAKAFKVNLDKFAANLRTVQTLFDSKSARELGLSEKRYANVRSGVLQAIRSHGANPGAIRARLAFNAVWKALLHRLVGKLQPYALHRLAYFCSVTGITPDQITPDVLKAFLEAIEIEGVVKNPRRALLQAVTHWNLCAKTIAGWPTPARLSMPTERINFMRPWNAFPVSLFEDYQLLVARLTQSDYFNEEAPRRALRPASVRNWEVIIRRFASALVESGIPTDSLHALKDLVPDFETYERGLRVLYDRTGKKEPTEYFGKHARIILNVATYHCGLEEPVLKRIKALCKRFEKKKDKLLAASNREKLRPFDDPDNVDKLLDFPKDEYARAKKASSPKRAAKYVERALAVNILINFCLRLYNLRTLRLDDFRWQKRECYLTIAKERVKNSQELDFLLPENLAKLLREFIDTHRKCIAEPGNEYLFAGRRGKPRHQNSLREQIEGALLKQAGLRVNPHLFRHIIAKIVAESAPGMVHKVSRLLGHATLDTTYQKYMGTEQRAAGVQLDEILQGIRHAPSRGRSNDPENLRLSTFH